MDKKGNCDFQLDRIKQKEDSRRLSSRFESRVSGVVGPLYRIQWHMRTHATAKKIV